MKAASQAGSTPLVQRTLARIALTLALAACGGGPDKPTDCDTDWDCGCAEDCLCAADEPCSTIPAQPNRGEAF